MALPIYGSAGTGAAQHLVAEYFNDVAGTNMKHVPFKGSGPADAAVMSGEIQAAFGILPAPRPQACKLRILDVTSKTRNASLPWIPSIDEACVPEFEFNFWQAMSLPDATPAPSWVACRLEEGGGRQQVTSRLTEQGYEMVASTPAYLADLMQRESTRWAKVIAAAGIRADA